MNEFLEYERFSDLKSASELIALLEVNQIHFEVDDSALHFNLSASKNNTLDNQLIIKVNESDYTKIDSLYSKKARLKNETMHTDHYLHSFSDNDIVDVIVNSEDWTVEEVNLARQISNQRELKPSAGLIKSLRKSKIINQEKQETDSKRAVSGSYSWFLWIAILSIINTVDYVLHNSVSFVFGLGITQIVDGLMHSFSEQFVYVGIVLNLLISSVFLVFWYYAKRHKQWAYLTGIILYTLDTVIFMVDKDWLSVGFHVFLLYALSSGYNALIKNQKLTIR